MIILFHNAFFYIFNSNYLIYKMAAMENVIDKVFDEYLNQYAEKALEKVIVLLEKKSFKSKIIKGINKNIDIPLLSEKTEAKIYDAIYGEIIDTIKKIDIDEE